MRYSGEYIEKKEAKQPKKSDQMIQMRPEKRGGQPDMYLDIDSVGDIRMAEKKEKPSEQTNERRYGKSYI